MNPFLWWLALGAAVLLAPIQLLPWERSRRASVCRAVLLAAQLAGAVYVISHPPPWP